MTPVRVIDASVVAAWVLPDEDSEPAAALVATAPGQSLAAPFHFPAEIGNVVVTSERRGRSTPEQSRVARDGVRALSFDIDPGGSDTVWSAAYPLSVRHGLTLYDALYLELALRLNLPLATFDRDLRRAAEAEGVRMPWGGVIDPAEVVRTALQDATSVAGILITPSAAVADAPKKGSGGGSGGGMGGLDF